MELTPQQENEQASFDNYIAKIEKIRDFMGWRVESVATGFKAGVYCKDQNGDIIAQSAYPFFDRDWNLMWKVIEKINYDTTVPVGDGVNTFKVTLEKWQCKVEQITRWYDSKVVASKPVQDPENTDYLGTVVFECISDFVDYYNTCPEKQ